MPVSARDIRYQAAVIDGQRLLLLRCAPWDEAPFWVLPGGGREAGESAEACVAREVREEAIDPPRPEGNPRFPRGRGLIARWGTVRQPDDRARDCTNNDPHPDCPRNDGARVTIRLAVAGHRHDCKKHHPPADETSQSAVPLQAQVQGGTCR